MTQLTSKETLSFSLFAVGAALVSMLRTDSDFLWLFTGSASRSLLPEVSPLDINFFIPRAFSKELRSTGVE